MLTRTFVHIPGIGKNTETSLWRQGCLSWSCLQDNLRKYSCGGARKADVREHLVRSQEALEASEHQYFQRYLGQKEAWRAFPEFRRSCVYLDIETDGGQSAESVSMIGLYDGQQYICLTKGDNLENFRDIISNYSMIVTFFGASFDLPVLEKRFKGLKFDQIHIDLSPTLRKVGISGGLKKIEKELGIQRPEEVDGLNGYDAILLWRKYKMLRDERALQRLIAYNREDVVNLEKLAEAAYERMKAATLSEVEVAC